MVTFEKTMDGAFVAPTVRWPPDSRLSQADKAALDAYTRQLEATIRKLVEALKEVQTKVSANL